MRRALRGLGEGLWEEVELGWEGLAQEPVHDEFATFLPPRERRLVWPERLGVEVRLEWHDPARAPWLQPIGSTWLRPVMLFGSWRGDDVMAVAGALVWSGWLFADTDPFRLGVPWMTPIPDRRGHVARWEAASLSAAVDLLGSIETQPIDTLSRAVGLTVTGPPSMRTSPNPFGWGEPF